MSDRARWLFVVLLMIGNCMFWAWWLPLRWHVCQRLYQEVAAQLVCLGGG